MGSRAGQCYRASRHHQTSRQSGDAADTVATFGADQVFDKSTEIEALMLYCDRLASSESGDSVSGVATLA